MNSWKLPGVRRNKETNNTITANNTIINNKTANTGSSSQSSSTNEPKNGVLLIRVCEARGISPPANITLPSVPPQPVHQNRNRDSLTRKQNWWLPYVVLEFDKNEILIDALGGDTANPIYQHRANFDVSRSSEVSISIYMRHPPTQGESTSRTTNDFFLGGVKIQPNFGSTKIEDQVLNIVGGTGMMHIQLCYRPQQQSAPITFDSFELLRVIGRGSFGKVYVVRKKDTNRIYAMKVLRKSRIISRSEVTHTMAEKTVLAQIRNPFIVPLKFAFQSPDKLYLVLAFINGGELFHHLQLEGKFSEERSRFYTAELLSALECLHDFNVVYRDLKPENILIDYNGHIALCDFGLCKLNMSENERTNTFCGTPEYLAPELLLGQGYTKTVDWWTLGVLLYEMMTGLPPFYDENTNEMYRKILQDELRFPDDMSTEARSLLRGLLTRDPNERLGNNGSEEIKNHPFFASIDWRKLNQKKLQPPYKPSVESAYDTQNFDDEFTSEAPQESLVDESQISSTMQEQFAGFTYNPANEHMGESYTGTSAVGSAGASHGSAW
ncbi:Pkinase-domain-containing protein [Rhizopus microsporus var. microsporus]|uniref:non-specific serine/threonine protein kinase n=2 Tax=Rhizopus microsporus TaxID=58291 RepID=A0A2G4T2S3_RHIZD|nr:AGC/AKT protein kinase [Rhizopus microsporus ATCC 52813]ORE02451.1 Pkinase-domain-containing protein [Rhizopus microsporus var. microsporus]PHZ15315.1 AGC/AKT protein kinase [Rhizopus microsporus ATCC 52813]